MAAPQPGELTKSITFQTIQEGEWVDYYTCRAKVNTIGGNLALSQAEYRDKDIKDFTVRCCAALVDLKKTEFRILYRGRTYYPANIYDYMERHRWLTIRGNDNG